MTHAADALSQAASALQRAKGLPVPQQAWVLGGAFRGHYDVDRMLQWADMVARAVDVSVAKEEFWRDNEVTVARALLSLKDGV